MTRWLVAVTAAVVVVVDQLTKSAVVRALGPEAERHRVDLAGRWLAIEYAENRGVAFGLLRSLGGWVPLLAAAVLAAIVVVVLRQPRPSAVLGVATGLAVGGAVGNLIDRARLGHVVDFIAVGPWPNFNVADAAITVGVATVAVWFLVAGPDATGGKATEQAAAVSNRGTGGR